MHQNLSHNFCESVKLDTLKYRLKKAKTLFHALETHNINED